MDRGTLRYSRRFTNLHGNHNCWYSIKNRSDGPTVINIYDEIGVWGTTAQDFVSELSQVKGPIELHLNSPGGEVFDGIAIYNALKQHKAGVSVVIDSLAASIASVIAMAASPGQLTIAKNATMMIHDGFGLCMGNAADMREMADLLGRTSDNIASIYAERSGQPVEQWRTAMLAETWYMGAEARDAGLVDSVLGEDVSTDTKASNKRTSISAEHTTDAVDAEPSGLALFAATDASVTDDAGTETVQPAFAWLDNMFTEAFGCSADTDKEGAVSA